MTSVSGPATARRLDGIAAPAAHRRAAADLGGTSGLTSANFSAGFTSAGFTSAGFTSAAFTAATGPALHR